MYPLIDLTSKNIVIAGASKGIGRACAVLMSQLGGKLTLIARNEDGLRETLSMMEGEEHRIKKFDFTDIEGIDSLVKNIVEDSGAADVIVYCVGITNDRPIHLIKPKELEKVMHLNFNAFVELVRCFAKKDRFNPGLRITAVSSISSLFGKKAHLSYSASKAAINAAVRNMSVELADKKIYVNAVLPGMVNTDMFTNYLASNGGIEGQDYQRLIQRQYLGIGDPRDVASAVAFLSSSAYGGDQLSCRWGVFFKLNKERRVA